MDRRGRNEREGKKEDGGNEARKGLTQYVFLDPTLIHAIRKYSENVHIYISEASVLRNGMGM